MGYDGSIQLFNPAEQERRNRRWAARADDIAGALDDVPQWIRRIQRLSGDSVERLDSLDPPPACNMAVGDIQLYLSLPFPPGKEFRCQISVTGYSHSVIEVYVPKFLARHSEAAASLWSKLMGSEAHYDIELGERAFRFEGHLGGYLRPSERQELCTELKPILAHTDAFYEAAAEYYDKPVGVLDMTIIECVYGLCAMGEDSARRSRRYALGYRRSS